MPNRYSHASVLSDYAKRGVFDSIYEGDLSRYHQPIHDRQSSTSSFTPSSTRSSLSYTIPTSQRPPIPKASPPRPVSTVLNPVEHLEERSLPQSKPRPTPASPPAHTPSSVVTQIYKPQSPRSYFDSDYSHLSHARATQSFSPNNTDLYNPLSPLPSTLDYFDLDSSPGSEKTTPRSSVDGLTLDEMLLEAIPPSVLDRPTHIPYEGSYSLDDEADDAVPPPIPRYRRDSTRRTRRPSTPIARPLSRQSISFDAQAWTPPRAANATSGPGPFQPSQGTSIVTPPKSATPSQTRTYNLPNDDNSRPSGPTLQRTRTDLNHEELQQWKKEVQGANWRRGGWVGALVGLKGFRGRRGSRD